MNQHRCEEVVPPGTVVLLIHGTDSRRSTWGVSLPYEYWASRSTRKVIQVFHEYSKPNPQIPVLECLGGGRVGDSRLCFRGCADMVPLCPLEYFLDGWNSRTAEARILRACCYRDGCMYYSDVLTFLSQLAVASSKELTVEMVRGKHEAGVLHALPHGQAIWKWHKEYTEMRQRFGYEEEES